MSQKIAVESAIDDGAELHTPPLSPTLSATSSSDVSELVLPEPATSEPLKPVDIDVAPVSVELAPEPVADRPFFPSYNLLICFNNVYADWRFFHSRTHAFTQKQAVAPVQAPIAAPAPAATSWADEEEDSELDCSAFAEWGYTPEQLAALGLVAEEPLVVAEDLEEAYDFTADERFVDLRALRKPLPARESRAEVDRSDVLRKEAALRAILYSVYC